MKAIACILFVVPYTLALPVDKETSITGVSTSTISHFGDRIQSNHGTASLTVTQNPAIWTKQTDRFSTITNEAQRSTTEIVTGTQSIHKYQQKRDTPNDSLKATTRINPVSGAAVKDLSTASVPVPTKQSTYVRRNTQKPVVPSTILQTDSNIKYQPSPLSNDTPVKTLPAAQPYKNN
ncbi:uncharacterized protein LOC129724382 [Wyeomyia smithii]|uniref:uncharacterized protein LOC129724382 n=1 Tax=Wyeomyia smithii TaxID=174621 RepID=UPI002467C6E0|nr:uncharacterized protein LOC129724382 [Wyeomyia smithii]XP_055535232.1 uncharacterized protein LOC129724382 [Wyeomyia smithii]XP_055535233.1 uncharacterized protein LOC129724382 [Wyeomyia smithii]XP_055535234.1 uncharacterized protein LOC129724382 [Wyeomyia smithii]